MTDNVIKSLQWLIFNFPKFENPKDDAEKISNCIHLYCQNAVGELNRQKAEIENLRKVILNGEFISHTAEKVKEEWHRGNIERINGLRAEIERVKKESDEWERRFINRCRDYELEIQKNEKLKAKIAVLSMKNADFDIENKAKDVFMDTVWPNLIKNAKTEAVREFSVAVQDAFAEYFKIDEIPVWYVTDKILGVEEAKIKELVGDDK